MAEDNKNQPGHSPSQQPPSPPQNIESTRDANSNSAPPPPDNVRMTKAEKN